MDAWTVAAMWMVAVLWSARLMATVEAWALLALAVGLLVAVLRGLLAEQRWDAPGSLGSHRGRAGHGPAPGAPEPSRPSVPAADTGSVPAAAVPPVPAAPAVAPAPPAMPAQAVPAGTEVRATDLRDLFAHFHQWEQSSLSTRPVNRVSVDAAACALYATAGLKAPRVVVVPSPLAMVMAYALASAIDWLRSHGGHGAPGIPVEHAIRRAGRLGMSHMRVPVIEALRDRPRRLSEQLVKGAHEPLQGLPEWLLLRERAATLGLPGEWALAVQAHISGLVRESPWLVGGSWEAESLATYTAAGNGALLAVGRREVWPGHAAAMTAVMSWLACCMPVREQALRLWLEFGFRWWLQQARVWLPLAAGVPSIGAARLLLADPGEAFERFKVWETCTREACDLAAHPRFCIVSDRPRRIRRDGRSRMHAADGPAVAWGDGWGLYYWHGLRIPWGHRDIIEHPQRITVDRIDRQRDDTIRQVMIDRFGTARYVSEGGALVVHSVPSDHPVQGLRGARLLRKDQRPGTDPIVFVELVNSTPEPDGSHRRYMLRVDPRAYDGLAARDCHAAAASTWRRADGSLAYPRYADYQPGAES